jgi:hypothetical protein
VHGRLAAPYKTFLDVIAPKFGLDLEQVEVVQEEWTLLQTTKSVKQYKVNVPQSGLNVP